MSDLENEKQEIQGLWDNIIARNCMEGRSVLSALYMLKENLETSSDIDYVDLVEYLADMGVKRLPRMVGGVDNTPQNYNSFYKMPMSAWVARAFSKYNPVASICNLERDAKYDWLQDKNSIILRRRKGKSLLSERKKEEKEIRQSTIFVKARNLGSGGPINGGLSSLIK